MSNSPLVTYTNLTKNCSRRTHKIDTITIHCYVGQVTAQQGCDMFATTIRQASANYVVGFDGSIGLSVEESCRAWTSDSRSNDDRAVTIEVASGTTYPYSVTPKAYEALIALVADICRRNGIPELKWKADKSLIGHPDQQNMTVHRWFAYKECPGQYLYERHGEIAQRVNALLGTPKAPEMLYTLTTGEIPQALAQEAAKALDALKIPYNLTEVDGQTPAPEDPPAAPRTYTVKRGDSLYKIAIAELQDGSRWREIQEINHLPSSEIYPGQVLILPEK